MSGISGDPAVDSRGRCLEGTRPPTVVMLAAGPSVHESVQESVHVLRDCTAGPAFLLSFSVRRGWVVLLEAFVPHFLFPSFIHHCFCLWLYTPSEPVRRGPSFLPQSLHRTPFFS